MQQSGIKIMTAHTIKNSSRLRAHRHVLYTRILHPAILILLIPVILYAQPEGGGYAESYLLRNIGGRPTAMAGAYSAISNEPNTIFYNPAGLSGLSTQPMFSSMHTFMEWGRTHTSLAWGQNFFDNWGFGAGINNFTTGSFTARDIKGNPLGDFTDWQFAFFGGASYRMEFASMGVAVKYLSHNLVNSDYRADGFAFDLGSKFNVMDMFNFAVSIQNISAMMFWNTPSGEDDLLPYTIRTGIAMEYGMNDEEYQTRNTVTGELETVYVPSTKYILVGIDAVLTQFENAPRFILGVEGVPHELIAFRGGIAVLGDNKGVYGLFPMTDWGLGVSLRPDHEELQLPFKINIDYSVSADYLSTSGIAHHLSVEIEFPEE